MTFAEALAATIADDAAARRERLLTWLVGGWLAQWLAGWLDPWFLAAAAGDGTGGLSGLTAPLFAAKPPAQSAPPAAPDDWGLARALWAGPCVGSPEWGAMMRAWPPGEAVSQTTAKMTRQEIPE